MRTLLAIPIVVALTACGGDGDGGGSDVDRVMDRYEECGLFTGDELDEQRDAIEEALEVLPADQEEEYLNDLYLEDDLCESTQSGEEASEDPEGFEPPEEVSADVVRQWPEKWCSVAPGITRDELVEVMGEEGLDETQESLSWSGFNYMFNAFLSVDGIVNQMDINDVSLSSQEKAELECETTRIL